MGLSFIGRVMRNSTLIFIFVLINVALTPRIEAAISGSVGAGSCDAVTRLLSRNWWDVKDVMSAGEKKKRKPRTGDFRCISPRYTRGMMQTTIPALRNELVCFTSKQYPAICCDARMQSCASL